MAPADSLPHRSRSNKDWTCVQKEADFPISYLPVWDNEKGEK